MTSNQVWAHKVREYVNQRFPDRHARILDIGAGWGTYYNLLGDRHDLDAIEVFEQYIEEACLRHKYKHVFCQNALGWKLPEGQPLYDLTIHGDGLEHFNIADAQKLVRNMRHNASENLFIIPYEYPQDAIRGNVYEIHLQPDLTPQIMHERYPTLYPLFVRYDPTQNELERGIGVYTTRKPDTGTGRLVVFQDQWQLPWFQEVDWAPAIELL